MIYSHEGEVRLILSPEAMKRLAYIITLHLPDDSVGTELENLRNSLESEIDREAEQIRTEFFDLMRQYEWIIQPQSNQPSPE